MVFLNKNREKGLKAKKKAQPIEKKPSTDIKPQPTQQVQPQQTQVKSQNNNNNNAAQNLLSSSPWWVSDVIFVVEGRKIPAHKVVLSSRSNFFARLQVDSPQEFEIKDYSYHIFSQYVKWIYGGTKEILAADASDLCRCAFQFESQELVNLCEKIIVENQVQIQIQNQEPKEIQQQQYQPQLQQFNNYQEISNDQIVNTMLAGEISSDTYIQDYEYDPHIQTIQEEYSDIQMEVQFDISTFGMNTWSNDPVLFAPEHAWEDVIPVMEIC